jgi:general secretion pathway protein A
MYKKFFGLAEDPFNITPDSKFLFLSQRHREALSALLYGVRERKGFTLLTGEIGSGKTTMCRALVNELRTENVKLALILNPGLSELELLKAINDEFQIPSFYNTKKGLVDELNRFLIAENRKGNNVVLIIDEAQNLEPSLLEQIRLLSNLETESDKLVQIVLIGQPELNETLALSQLEQFNQRITVRYHITPLSDQEMHSYIKHRLFVARAKVDIDFTDGALKQLFAATRGVPRKINVVCDRALLACYVDGSYTVDDKVMQKAIQEVAGSDSPSGPAGKRRGAGRGIGGAVRSGALKILTRKAAITVAAVGSILVLVAAAVAVGVRLANVSAMEDPQPKVVTDKPEPSPAPSPAPGTGAGKDSSDTESTETQEIAKAAPTATPDWDVLRRKNPNWKYERNAPLVRVNNPRLALRASQLSMLKMWGYAVDLNEMANLGDDLVMNGVFKLDPIKITQVRLPGGYYDTVKLNNPVIVRLKDPQKDQSEHVVLLKAEGEAVTVGDPVWGVKTYKTKEFIKRWDSATAVFVDVNQLAAIQRGEASDRVRALQQYLKDRGYLKDVSGKFDVDTVEAIRKFQSYYQLKETGQLDDLTVMLLNSRIMRDGPRLSATGD